MYLFQTVIIINKLYKFCFVIIYNFISFKLKITNILLASNIFKIIYNLSIFLNYIISFELLYLVLAYLVVADKLIAELI
jgi:hypothetical protein